MFDYQSPVEMLVGEMTTRIENACNATIQQKLGFNIDKEELVKALQYDRHQYEKGYQDGKAEAKQGTGWISVNDRLPECESVIKCNGFKFKVSADVLLWNESEGYMFVGSYDYSNNSWLAEYDNPTHWMPLPEPPEEVNKNG